MTSPARMLTEPSDLARGRRVPLGAYLVANGLVTSEQIEEALEEQRHSGVRLGEILIAHGVLYEADVACALAQMSGVPYRDLDLNPPDASVLGQIPEGFCRRRAVMPIGLEDGELMVAISDPADIETLDDLRVVVPVPIRTVVVALGQLRRVIESAYQGARLGAEGAESGNEGSDADNIADIPDADLSFEENIPRDEAPVERFVNQLFRRAVEERVSDVHLEPTKTGLRVRFRVDGMLFDVTGAQPALALGVISRVKIMTGMDIAEHRRPQDGRMSTVVQGVPLDVRAATLPTIDGEAIILRLLLKDRGQLDIDALGFLPESLTRYQRSFHKGWGMILVTGPTGSGKSTTLYATVKELNVPTRNTVTVEDPIEYRVPGIKQTQVNTRAGYTFAAGLRAALRSDPDIILIGEIRDQETARIAAESALTGHLLLSTLHANDAASSTTRLIDMGVEPYLVTSSLECVVAQRLLRRLCPRCRVQVAPSPDELLELESMELLDTGTGRGLSIYRPNGCAHCTHSGYRGRLAVQEVLVMNEELKTLVLARAPAEQIAKAATVGGMTTLRQNAFRRVRDGDTSLEELKRTLA
jgi:type IV pilus assembly protein PilB